MSDDDVVNFRGIKQLGIPCCRTHIWRLMRRPFRRTLARAGGGMPASQHLLHAAVATSPIRSDGTE